MSVDGPGRGHPGNAGARWTASLAPPSVRRTGVRSGCGRPMARARAAVDGKVSRRRR
jgi:hypothetical protein